MAISKSQHQIKWDSTANSKAIASGTSGESEPRTINDAAAGGSVSIKVDHSGTPASGDITKVFILYTNGDTDADPGSSDEYDTPEHGLPIEFDSNSEDPAIKTINVDPTAKGFKLRAENEGASSVTVSAQYSEQTVS